MKVQSTLRIRILRSDEENDAEDDKKYQQLQLSNKRKNEFRILKNIIPSKLRIKPSFIQTSSKTIQEQR